MPDLSTDMYTRLVNAKIFIDHHFDEAIDLDRVADKAHVSAFHFHRLFTRVYRITPHQYITKKRLEKAKELLKKGELTIAGICNDIGFESHGSFTTLFKKYQGLSPKIFRSKEQELKKKAESEPRYLIPNCFMESH